jgi:hypothetical protein
MLLNKLSLTIPAQFTGDNDARYMLNGVHITDKEIIATNGHYMCRLSHQAGLAAPDFPVVGQSAEMEPFKAATVSAKDFAAIAKQIKKSQRLPVLQHALLDTTAANANGSVPVYVTDLENPQVIKLEKFDGNYPNTESVMPTDEPAYGIAFDPAYLEVIGKAFKQFGARSVQMNCFAKTTAPALFTATNRDTKQDLTVLLMPTANKENGIMSVRSWAENIANEHADYEYES